METNMSTPPPLIRAMAMNDYEHVLALWLSCSGIGLSEADKPNAIAAYLARNPSFSQTAWTDSTLIGAVLAGHDGRRGYLHHVAVHPDYRRNKIGSLIVRAALDALATAGIEKVHAFLFTDNTEGLHFWTTQGWTVRKDIGVISTRMPT